MGNRETDSKSLLTGGIAQEVSNLLSFLLGELLLLQSTTDETEREQRLQSMDRMLLRACDLGRQLLTQLGSEQVVPGSVDLNELVAHVAEGSAGMLQGGQRVTVRRAASLPKIDADPAHVRQVIKSLISTAVARHPRGDLTLCTGAEWLLEDRLNESAIGRGLPTGEYVYCEIRMGDQDGDGPVSLKPGLDACLLEGGMDAIALLGIVKSYRGVVACGNTSDASVVRVYLPASETVPSKPRKPQDAEPEWRGSGTALFVDDEESVRMLGERLLDAFGFEVVTANDGRDGVQKFRQMVDKVALVVLDVTMPYLNGLEAFKEMRRMKPDVPVLFISGYANAVNEASLDRRAAFLPKPFRMADMRAKIRQLSTATPSRTE